MAKKISLSEKFKDLEELLGKKPSEMAKMGGVSLSTYYRYRNGNSTPDGNFISNILKNEKRINADWFLKNNGPALLEIEKDSHKHDKSQQKNLKITHLPFYNMRPANNTQEGMFPKEEWIKNNVKFPVYDLFINQYLRSKPENLFVLAINCDSMTPEIKAGSIVYVDKTLKNSDSDGIFILMYDNLIRMKVIQQLPGKRVLLSTLNEKYKAVELSTVEFQKIKVLGRIVWRGSMI